MIIPKRSRSDFANTTRRLTRLSTSSGKKELVVVVDGTKPVKDVEKEILTQLRLPNSAH